MKFYKTFCKFYNSPHHEILNFARTKHLMKTVKFKTNINCAGCVAKVSPFLNDHEGLESWDIDTSTPDKILTVELEDSDPITIIEAINKAGFKIESITAFNNQ